MSLVIPDIEIGALRALASRFTESGQKALIDPGALSAILDRVERAEKELHLSEVMLGAIGLPWEIESKEARAMTCHQALLECRSVERISDQTIAVTFPSCRLASVFEQLANAAKEPQS